MWTILASKSFQKSYDKLDEKIQKKVDSLLVDLSKEYFPPNWDIKKMFGRDGEYRCRIGIYRILYKVVKKEVFIYILDIDHRKDIYKK